MARYGIPYLGSKSRIAEWVVENLPPADTLVDLFAGGCAVTHAAVLSGKFEHFIVNDISDAPKLFIDAVNGKYADESRVPTREEFHALKDSDPYIRYVFSFGNNGRNYLWDRDLEPVKVAACKMIASPTLDERHKAYHDFVRALQPYLTRRGLNENERLQRLQRLQGLERLQRLQGLQGLELDYREVELPSNATVYCDPPYRNTNCGCYGGFDSDAFDEWLASCGRLVIVSEYTAPRGCVEVARRAKQCSASANGRNQRVIERLFVHESHLDEYRERMRATDQVD